MYNKGVERFLSTPSARRATGYLLVDHHEIAISIHALREEGDTLPRALRPRSPISIHALREEGDKEFSLPICVDVEEFLSTPSARRATFCTGASGAERCISIHALREEGDLPGGAAAQIGGYFYPRPPRGGRPRYEFTCPCCDFISIHALREEGDDDDIACLGVGEISIHALREEGDAIFAQYAKASSLFLSTPSARRATNALDVAVGTHAISIHALREEGDLTGQSWRSR